MADLGQRIADALRAVCSPCHPAGPPDASVSAMGVIALLAGPGGATVVASGVRSASKPSVAGAADDVDELVARVFDQEGQSLVRLVRLFVDDRNAAEDLVQEGFIRLARNAGRIKDETKTVAYLRSIVLNLARDHNRRGLVSMRYRLPLDDERASTEDEIVLRDDQQAVVDALRKLAPRQRDCLVLRYYDELGIDEIAETLGISRNSVKTHLTRGMQAMAAHLDMDDYDDTPAHAGEAGL